MVAQWTGAIVGKMHIHKISNTDLAQKLGVSDAWVSMVLNGHRNPAGAEARFNAALDELIAKRGDTP